MDKEIKKSYTIKNISKKLYEDFMIICIKKGTSMAKVLRSFIQKYVDGNKDIL